MAWLLGAIAGRQVALDLLLTARVVLAEEAAHLGLISRAVPSDELMPTVMALASDLASNVSPASMATIKHQMNSEPLLTAHDALVNAEGLMRESLAGADVVEGVTSFLEKRQVRFPSLGEGTRFGWMDD